MPRIWTPDEKVLERYRSSHGKPYEPPLSSGFSSIPVLEFLWGKELSALTFNWLRAVSPSYVRIIKSGGEEKTDAMPWRVSLYLGKDNKTIAGITQEVEVGCDGVDHGHGLRLQTVPEGFREPEWDIGSVDDKSTREAE